MPKGVFVVQSNPSDPAQEAAFNEWYDGTHVPEILTIPGFVSARRFTRFAAELDKHRYLAIYELDADDLSAPLIELQRRSAAGEITLRREISFDRAPITTLYQQIG